MTTHSQIFHQITQSQATDEAALRRELTRLYHTIDGLGMGEILLTHNSCRVALESALLINPFGLLLSEVTPDNLVKIDLEGKALSKTDFPVNENGSLAHRVIYKARPDVNWIIHTHARSIVAVSNLIKNEICLDQLSMIFHNRVSYHDFDHLFIKDGAQTKMIEDLGNKNIMILKNHGMITVGKTAADAFWYAYFLEYACDVYLRAASTGQPLQIPTDATKEEAALQYERWAIPTGSLLGDRELFYAGAKRKAGVKI